MKRLLTILFFCATAAVASNKYTSGNMTMSVLAPVPSDTVYVRAAHTLTVDVTHVGMTCAAIVDSGKMIHSAGSRINIGGLRVTGTDSMLAGSRMDIYNDDRLGADDIQISGSGKFYAIGSVSSPAQIFGQTNNGTLPNWPTTYTGQRIKMRRANVRGFQGSWPSAGLTFNSFASGMVDIRFTDFDSASISFRLTGGHLLLGCTFDTYAGMNRAIILQSSPNDTIMGCRVRHNALGGTNDQSQGIYVWSNNTVIWGCNIKDTNFSSTTNYGGDYGINMEQNQTGTKMVFDTITGWQWGVLEQGGNSFSMYGCEVIDGEHECILTKTGTNITISNCLIRSRYAARALVTLGYGATSISNISLLYNTIVAEVPNIAKSAVSIDCPTAPCGVTATGMKFVGNIFDSDNPTYPGDFGIYGGTVTFTEFKKNAMGRIDTTTNASDIILPYSITDSNTFTETYTFVNPAAHDYRLGSGSTMKNAGDSAYGCQVYGDFRAATRPFNIGYDQNFYNRWNYGKHSWIRTAAICYGVTDSIAGHFIGRHNDLMINPGNTAYGSRSGVLDNARRADSMVKAITYSTISSIREQDNQAGGYIARFLARFPSYVRDSIYQWLDNNGGSVTLRGQQSSCGSQTNTINANDTVRVCGWTEANRKVLDFRQPAARQFVKFKAIDVVGGEQAKYDGPFFDEFSTYWAPVNYFNSPTNSTYGMVYPFGSGDWNPTTGFQRVRGWQTWTYAQIIDSCIKLKQRVWLKGVVDTLNLYGFKMFGNNSDYDLLNYPSNSTTNVGEVWFDAMRTGSGLTMFENGNSPWIYGNATRGDKSRNAWLWQVMDSINAWDTGQIICWHDIMPQESLSVAGLGGWGRCQMERLVFHYMAASNRCYFLLTSNMPGPLLKPNDYIAGDTLYKWVPAADRDVGQPTGARYVVATGTDGAGQSYTIYRRDFTNAIMLYRAASGNPGSVGASSAVVYNLGQIATPLNVNNTTGTQTTTASIRNMEGQIYLITATGDTTISVTGGSAVEGQPIVFTVTLTTPSGLPLLAPFDFTVNTTNGSAQSSGDFVAQTNNVYTFSAGAMSRTFTVTTLTDAATEGDETFTATISNPTLAGVKLGTATAIGTIVDVPPTPAATGNYLQFWRIW